MPKTIPSGRDARACSIVKSTKRRSARTPGATVRRSRSLSNQPFGSPSIGSGGVAAASLRADHGRASAGGALERHAPDWRVKSRRRWT